MSIYIVAYDISNDSRRLKVAKILKEFGRRLQNSVFEIDVEPEDLAELRLRLGLLLAKRDLLDFFPLDRRDPKRRISWQRDPVPPDGVIVI